MTHTHDYREVEHVTLVNALPVTALDDGILDLEFACVICGDGQMGWRVVGVEDECGCKRVCGEVVWPCSEHERPVSRGEVPISEPEREHDPDERACWAGQTENVWGIQ